MQFITKTENKQTIMNSHVRTALQNQGEGRQHGGRVQSHRKELNIHEQVRLDVWILTISHIKTTDVINLSSASCFSVVMTGVLR